MKRVNSPWREKNKETDNKKSAINDTWKISSHWKYANKLSESLSQKEVKSFALRCSILSNP